MFRFSKRSLDNLAGVHPMLIAVACLGLAKSEVDFVVTEGVRDPARQKMLVAEGKSQTLKSYHLPQSDGYGHAFDVVAWVNGTASYDRPYLEKINEAMQAAARELGVKITWGGTFKSLGDTPHYQYEGMM